MAVWKIGQPFDGKACPVHKITGKAVLYNDTGTNHYWCECSHPTCKLQTRVGSAWDAVQWWNKRKLHVAPEDEEYEDPVDRPRFVRFWSTWFGWHGR